MTPGASTFTLDELCHHITDGKHGDCQEEQDSGYYFLSAKDVFDGKLNYNGARQITQADFEDTHKRTKLEPLDVVFTNSGTIGRMALVRADDLTSRTTFQKSVAILKPIRSKVEPRFLYYLLSHEKQRLSGLAGGTAQANLLLRDFRSFKVRVPDKGTQRRIADVLSAYDDLIENNTKRIKILEEMARSLYREWFVEFRFPGHEKAKFVETEIGRVPKGWEVKALGEVADIQWGDTSTTKASYTASGYTAYSASGPDGFMDHADIDRDGIVLSAIGAQCGKSWYAQGQWSCIKNTIRFWGLNEARASTQYLYFVTQSPSYWPKRGAAQPFISLGDARGCRVIIPSSAVMLSFTNTAKNLLGQICCLERCTSSLRAQRDLLLPRLISGEIELPT